MKMNKKAVTAASFILGALLFATTALADVALGSGYDRLKASMKKTASQLNTGIKSYTFEALVTLKDNGKVLMQSSVFQKTDNEKSATEETGTTQYANGKTESHCSYRDMQCSINRGPELDDKYYYIEFSGKNKPIKPEFPNPFDKKEAGDFEKLFDALIGNLKNYIQMEEKPEGGRKYSGSLSEEQVPALVNAAASFELKRLIREEGLRYAGNSASTPKMESDIVIKRITGIGIENKAGLLENLQAEVVFTGKDDKGVQHELSFNIVMKVTDMDKTFVTKPDLSGKSVEKVSNSSGFGSKNIGKYKNDIVIVKDGKFIKIGEKILEITSVDDKKVAGRYYETYKAGFESYNEDKYDFKFEFDREDSRGFFTYTNASGAKETGAMHDSGSRIYLDLNIEVMNGNSYSSHSRNAKNVNSGNELYRIFDN